MSVRFARLRIAGFKSFAEAASVEILPGLTGIVGPNGCGKSNIVEALRWAMGESSARSLRGGEMDDLIFAGTAARPARNLAEVTLTLEEATGIAPPPFHDQPELQISRRIERGAGSFYRVNGSEARARDVQTLFADLASGARSSAMVSQGRVAAIVNARPEERRSVLEEAAGITGLHARRHEAELKLRATEANLSRAEDLRLQLEARLGELGTQARQASRYREIAAGLRDAEAGLLALLHARARAAVEQARQAVTTTEAALHAATRRAHAATEAEQLAEAALPPPREAEATARTALERQRIAAESLAAEAARAQSDAAEAQARLEQTRTDANDAEARLDDATGALARIEADRAIAAQRALALPAELQEAEHALQSAQATLADATAALSHATAEETAARTRIAQNARDSETAAQRAGQLRTQHDALRAEHDAAQRDLPAEAELATLHAACEAAALALDDARTRAEQSGENRIQAARDADAQAAAAHEATRTIDAARTASTEAAQRAAGLARERAAIEQRHHEAEQAQVPEAARLAAEAETRHHTEALAAARPALEAAELAQREAQQAHAQARQTLANADQNRQQTDAARLASQAALARATAQHDQLAADAQAADAALIPDAALQTAQEQLHAAEAALGGAQQALADAEAARQEAERQATTENAALSEAVADQTRLEAEADGLARALGADTARDGQTLADILSVPLGLEAALAAILAEALEASPEQWQTLPPLPEPPLPAGTIPLSDLIEAPEPLARILSHSFLIEDAADAPALHASLAPGQSLVTRTGALWRWDGFRAAGGEGRTVVILKQRNRLREARLELEQKGRKTAENRARAELAGRSRGDHIAHDIIVRDLRASAEHALSNMRDQYSHLSAEAAAATARAKATAAQLPPAAQTRDEAARAAAGAAGRHAALPGLEALRERLDQSASAEAAALAAEAATRQAREQAETGLEAARHRQAALLARHSDAGSRLAALLPQQARLAAECAAADADAEAARATLEALPPADLERQTLARIAAEAAEAHDAASRVARREAEAAREQAQAAHGETLGRQQRQRSRLDALAPRLAGLGEEYREADALLAALQAEASGLPDADAGATDEARDAVIQAREQEAACRDTRAHFAGEAASVQATRDRLAAAHADWTRSTALAQAAHEAARARLAADAAAHDALSQAPGQAEQRRAAQAAALAEAGDTHAEAQSALDDAIAASAAAQSERRQADITLTEAREARLRLEGRAEQAAAILAQLLAETPDTPRTIPDDLSDAAESALRRRIARLAREREEIGPVNLRADLESREAQARADAIAAEHGELEAAIARLRGSIGHLNREGRERLLAVFETVDRHFQALFSRMFSGGRAHLGMVGDDDPLAAGLEIYAQPPGKKLATLSLLSGGEQALCALSLIFAVFRCNPAPVCVLDEVDAPLDDANVGRFCALLADMVAEAGTRFLVVTHHQLTMAHMDRLYGVTMQERGVSRLISVDLAAAAGMVTPARAVG